MSQNMSKFDIPTVVGYEPSSNKGSTLNDSPVRYEIVRMLLAGHSDDQISRDLAQYFDVKATPRLVSKFRENYYTLYSNYVTKWEESKVSGLAVRGNIEVLTAENRTILREVDELQNLIAIADERITYIRDAADRSAQYEKVLVELLRAKMALLERQTRVMGSSGMEERLKGVIKQTAIVIQETLLPFISEKDRERAYELFIHGIGEVLEKVEAM